MHVNGPHQDGRPRGDASPRDRVQRLRLVVDGAVAAGPSTPAFAGIPAGPQRASRSREQAAARDVARSNVEAAFDRTLDPRDPRWRVALEAAASMQGSLLSFERRRKILAFADRIGVRAFDANLIIAAVQDRARRGESVESVMPVIAHAAQPHPFVGPEPDEQRAGTPDDLRKRWVVAVALAAIIAHVAAIFWFFASP